MQQFLDTTLGGLVLGAVYAAFALALCLIWRSTRIVNFAQAAMAMVTTYIALSLINVDVPYWVAFLAAIAAGFMLGALVERLIIRPVEGKADLNAVILTLGLFMVLHGLTALVFGVQHRGFPAPVSTSAIEVGDSSIGITPFGILTIVIVALVMAGLVVLFRFTDLGLRMRASAFNGEVSRLLGVRVGRMLTLGWALAAAVGAVAGMLIAGGDLVNPAFMDPFVIYGFIAAVLGGLDSPIGSVIGGLILGLSLSYVTGYVGEHLAPLVALGILMLVLLVRPSGLFAAAAARRV
ncbi:branched-chain amino acid ABC transporter permease [Nocardioides panzhihuensis]|uniref:Branched-chain amino acid transport system permease protein n=1 Tax=Nocardioides panzhihuensis TaxID=860243 RepID=A0A7Z0DT16_9ACTN|nr:branched-chain amino acid ABC transporter permease [Nocardioides panzhihuensis]NYI81128.1 branched-chain amino acid transport system permease protein [Nocardioides panzhihuensis]